MAKINNNLETAKEKGEKYLRVTIRGILSHSLLSVGHGSPFSAFRPNSLDVFHYICIKTKICRNLAKMYKFTTEAQRHRDFIFHTKALCHCVSVVR
ncbi:MAG: hypothetical protein J5965_24840 [Aeriscardovia sp.]|nr:hypothetical protein [Aeriscardovia sp.]